LDQNDIKRQDTGEMMSGSDSGKSDECHHLWPELINTEESDPQKEKSVFGSVGRKRNE
jgi:hypothetical protein